MSTLPVVVVGAGPTGLMLAAALSRHGVAHRLIEAAPRRSRLSRALAVQARTLEILDSFGVADELVSRGKRLEGATLFAEGRQIVRVDFDELDTRFPFLLCLPQTETELVLEGLLERLGGRVERGTRLVGLSQREDAVSCRLEHAEGGPEVCDARWLVGADGAHSMVRKALGVDFPGHPYPDVFWLADARIDWDVPDHRVTTFFSTDGLLACFPLPGGEFRIVASAPEGAGDEDPSPSQLESLIRSRTGKELKLESTRWRARFLIHRRQVQSYRSARVFLAGDAAHIHSPLGGQGMNTGIQDAHNLAWKLALVEDGIFRPEVLDSYQAERHGVAEALLRATDLATRVATLRSPVARRVRDRVTQFLASLEVIQERITRGVAELDLGYDHSPIVGEFRSGLWRARFGDDEAEESPTLGAWLSFDAAPRPGHRAPDALARTTAGEPIRLSQVWDASRHTLLLFDGRASTSEGYLGLSRMARAVQKRAPDHIQVVIIIADSRVPAELEWDGLTLLDPEGDLEYRYGARAECLYLVRPDLYVAYRSQPAALEPLIAYLDGVLA